MRYARHHYSRPAPLPLQVKQALRGAVSLVLLIVVFATVWDALFPPPVLLSRAELRNCAFTVSVCVDGERSKGDWRN